MMSRNLVAAAAIAAMASMLLVANSSCVRAAGNQQLNAEVLRLSQDWEHIKFQVENLDEQEKQLAVLAEHAADIARRYPMAPEAMIWLGIVNSEQASNAGQNSSPFKALGFANRARDILEKIEKTDPKTMDAGAPTSLGVLYYRVPGFPISFGDKSKARKLLQEAIANAPNGLDANYFYGDFLYEQQEYPEAIKVLKRALALPGHPDRPVWDRSRRLVIQELLAKMQK
jgi:tetratricopeptide (TPR) repeat protein